MQILFSEQAPKAVGPYSHAVRAGNLLFCSGQIPLDPKTMQLVGTTAAEQARQVLANVEAVLGAAGLSFQHVVKTTIFLVDLSEFKAVNSVYEEAFASHRPARSTVQVAALPLGARVEIEVVAEFPAEEDRIPNPH